MNRDVSPAEAWLAEREFKEIVRATVNVEHIYMLSRSRGKGVTRAERQHYRALIPAAHQALIDLKERRALRRALAGLSEL